MKVNLDNEIQEEEPMTHEIECSTGPYSQRKNIHLGKTNRRGRLGGLLKTYLKNFLNVCNNSFSLKDTSKLSFKL
jgi:hypothetical protein